MRPNLAQNCLLQIEQERSEEESSVGDASVGDYCLCPNNLNKHVGNALILWVIKTKYSQVFVGDFQFLK